MPSSSKVWDTGMDPGRLGADVRVMSAVCREAEQLAFREQGRDQRHIGQVRAAQVGVVHDDHVAGPPLQLRNDAAHGVSHAAQVHRNVGGLGAQQTLRVEQGAGEVQPVLDVGGDGAALQYGAHFRAERLDAIDEKTSFYGIHYGKRRQGGYNAQRSQFN